MDVDTEMEMEGGRWTRTQAKYLRWLQRAVDSELYIQQRSLKFSSSAAGNVFLLACCLLADRQTCRLAVNDSCLCSNRASCSD